MYPLKCTVTSSKRREKLKAYNFVISGWVKPLQVLKRNSGYDSHDATSPSSFPHTPSDFSPSPFKRGSGQEDITMGKLWKDVFRYVLEHFGGLMRLIIFPFVARGFTWRISRRWGCLWTPLVAVDQKDNPAYPGFYNGGVRVVGAWPGGLGT